jgi:class 3 adenylate cyclase
MAEEGTGAPANGLIRRLATIMAADVAGFSRMMAEDEEATLLSLRAQVRVFEALVPAHRGRIFNTAGDAVLAEFDSAVEAVRCATEVQAALQTLNMTIAAPSRMMFRIGINLGDVLVEGSDLLGDGVNVAARLQTAADPGGICISGSVYDQISNKLSLSFQPLGETSFKNIPRPIRAFRVAEKDSTPPPASQPRTRRGFRLAVLAIGVISLGGFAVVLFGLPKEGDFGLFLASSHSMAPARQGAGIASTSPSSSNGTASIDGSYAGPICYGPINDVAGICYRAKLVVEGNRVSGSWPGREPGTTVTFSGLTSSTGDLKADIRTDGADGKRVSTITLEGRVQNGRIDATGTFGNGRIASINLRLQ